MATSTGMASAAFFQGRIAGWSMETGSFPCWQQLISDFWVGCSVGCSASSSLSLVSGPQPARGRSAKVVTLG